MRKIAILLVVVVGFLGGVLAAHAKYRADVRPALVVRPPALAERVAPADAVVVGKVESIEEKTVTALPPTGGDTKFEYYVAVVKIEDPVLNAKGLTHVKAAFRVPPPVNPGGIRPIGGIPQAKLEKDQEVCLILTSHPPEPFFVLNNGFQVLDKSNPNYEKDVAEVKRVAKLIDKPDDGLKSKDANDRLLTAAMLLLRYRTPIGASRKTEEVSAEQSKAILTTLAEANWATIDASFGLNLQPSMLFSRLELTDKDGWDQKLGQQDPTKLDDLRKQWFKDHADSYRIQRYVAEGKEKK
jgi:hypothetical protein